MILKLCPSGRYFWKNKWKKFENLNDLFIELFGKVPEELQKNELVLKPGIKRKCKIVKNGKKIVLQIEVTLSPKLSKEKSQYYEGILQVKNCDTEITDFIRNELKKANKKGIFITQEKLEKNRADFFITNQTYMKSLAVKLQKEFGGKISLNPTLFSRNRQTSKELYRLTIMLDIPKIRKNDVIIADNKIFVVNSAREKIHVVDLKGKKTALPYKNYKELTKQETRITKVYPQIEIMDPETYQSIEIQNKKLKKNYKLEQKVKVVYHNGWWIV